MNYALSQITLTEDQAAAAMLIEDWFKNSAEQIFVLCGYAGSGKTFLVDYIVRHLGLTAGKDAAFVTPTGKAASVLIRGGTPASTVHSLIYTREEDVEVNEDGEVISERFLRFVKKASLPRELKLIVVDETSMVSDDMLSDLLSYNVKCLFCGDPAQLPPVSGSNTLLASPSYTLTEIVRQAEGDPIVYLSQMARRGEPIPFGTFGEGAEVVSLRSLSAEEREEIFTHADQIIAGTNRTRRLLNREIRGYRGIPHTCELPVDGEKLICTMNDWSKALDAKGEFHLVNGIIGNCYAVRKQQDGLGQLDFQPDFLPDTVYDLPFDTGIFCGRDYFHAYGAKACLLDDGTLVHEDNKAAMRFKRIRREDTICRFEFAYAVTCHKAQGSEFDYVAVVDESRLFEPSWLYTAITRAKKRLVILR